MATVTDSQLAGLAASRLTNAEISSVLGRELTDGERAVVDRARAAAKIKRATRGSGQVPLTAAEKMRAGALRAHTLERRPCADPARRKRLEANPERWLRQYLPGVYPLPFSESHREIIRGALAAAERGGGFGVAAPRGEGKTTLLRGLALYLVLTDRCRFPVLAGWTRAAAMGGFRTWVQWITGEPIRADYPEFVQPFELSTHSSRLALMMWGDTGKRIGCHLSKVDRLMVFGDGLGACAYASVQGEVKGLQATAGDSILRPDLLLLDDAQDAERADQPAAVAATLETLDRQWFCLAGPATRLSVFAAVTIAAKGDVGDSLLSRSDWSALRVGRVTSWPTGWLMGDQPGPARQAWDRWHAEHVAGLAAQDGGRRGRAYYRAHKPDLTAGMAVSWKHRYDKKRGDPDAFYSAMFDFYRVGATAFASEYQNDPIVAVDAVAYQLTPQTVMRRCNGRTALTAPGLARVCVAAVDVNHYGLHWVLPCFEANGTGYVAAYGRWPQDGRAVVPKNATEPQRETLIAEHLAALLQYLASLRPVLDGAAEPTALLAIGVDRAYCARVVHRVAQAARLGVRVVPMGGRDGHRYSPLERAAIGRPGHRHHVAETQYGPTLWFDADHWREVAQRAWLATPGAPGGLTLYGSEPAVHVEFAEQVTAEQLSRKTVLGGKTFCAWTSQPGQWHDYGDALTMAFALACYVGGIGSGTVAPAAAEAVAAGTPGDVPAAVPVVRTKRPAVTYVELK